MYCNCDYCHYTNYYRWRHLSVVNSTTTTTTDLTVFLVQMQLLFVICATSIHLLFDSQPNSMSRKIAKINIKQTKNSKWKIASLSFTYPFTLIKTSRMWDTHTNIHNFLPFFSVIPITSDEKTNLCDIHNFHFA